MSLNINMSSVKTQRKTTKIVAEKLLEHCNINENKQSEYLILEPSAGSGILVNEILQKYPKVEIHCVELNKELRETLIKKKYKVIGEDFLKLKTDTKYDFIIACPTFKNNVDVLHIMKMYTFLKKGGVIVSLTTPHWTTKNSKHQIKFREWLKDKNYHMVMLDDKSFIENYETQPTALIHIKK